MKIGVLDPKCIEFVRGGLCFSPYLVYSYLKSEGHDVEMFEDWPMDRELPDKDVWIIGLWSYPQVEACRYLDIYLPGKKFYTGYVPLIEACGFTPYEAIDKAQACYWFAKLLPEFTCLDPYDMDAHVKGYDGKFVPVLLSHGCDYKCRFCPTAGSGRVSLTREQIREVLASVAEMNVSVHFHDEDLFQDLDTALFILDELSKHDFDWLCLSSVKGLADVIRSVGPVGLLDAGYILAELGLESADVEIQRSMGKVHRDLDYVLLHPELRKFWLTITFYPGETIESIAKTGEFLRRYGFEPDEMLPRMATASCEGGLGQFFQPYIGTPPFATLKKNGMLLTVTYQRLVPSYLPYSFLHQVPFQVAPIPARLQGYLDLYGIDDTIRLDSIKTVGEIVGRDPKKAIELAIMARLGVIAAR